MGNNGLRIGVIGAGHLGKIHARLLKSQKEANLVFVADPSPSAQQAIIDELDARTLSDYRKAIDEIDAAVIATPTRTHYDIAQELLERGIHTLIEKPLTDSVTDAQRIVELADRQRCVVQVGHVERFNPAIQTALEKIGQPKFINSSRMSGYTFRSTDIGVVHDLMIHDIDLVNNMFGGNLVETRAIGMSVFGHHEDLAQARLHFDCGGIANLTASRCSFQNERSMQIFGTEGFASINLAESKVTLVNVPDWLKQRKYDVLDTTPEQQAFIRDQLFQKILPKSELKVPTTNAILAEQKDWISAIRNGDQPKITAKQGQMAVEVAQSVLDSLAGHRWSQQDAATTGPFSLVADPEIGISHLLAEQLKAA